MDRRWLMTGLSIAAVVFAAAPVRAGKVTLKNGTEIEGELVEIKAFEARQLRQQAGELATTPYLLVDAGYKRYLVADRQVAGVDRGRNLIAYDFFELPQKRSHSETQLASVGLPKHVTGFSDRGVRTATFQTAGEPRDIVQGVTRIGPEYVTVEGINFRWWQGIATEAVPRDQLAAMIRSAIDPQSPEDRMSVVRFYTEAGLYEPAAAELESIRRDFPFLAGKADELEKLLLQMRARALLAELRTRQAAGQHRLALAAAESFPTGLDFEAEVLRQVEEIRGRYAAEREKGDRAVLLLGELEAGLEDAALRAAVAALRPVVRQELDWESLPRLNAFLTLAEDETLGAKEKLALAYSSWVVGPAKGTTDLTKALGLWRTRHVVGEYLRSADAVRKGELIEELKGIEGVGAAAVADLVPLLPPWAETPEASPGRATVLETLEAVPGWGADVDRKGGAAGPVRYAVTLPPEYTPTRSYPLIVALRAAEWSVEQAAAFWGLGLDGAGREAAGPATRAGYVVISPEYGSPKQVDYGYTAREHEAVLAAIRDAKKRFVIDSDRVFLVGHGMGGNAAYDVAMAHPDLFAGAAPVSGLCLHHTRWYWQNADRVPFYCVNGELDRASRDQNANVVSHMMKAGHDVTYCEYVGRGYEYYQEEIPNLIAWMGRLRRAADPKKVEANVLRASDDRFYWVSAEGIPKSALVGDAADPSAKAPVRPMTLTASIAAEANTITLGSPATRHVLRLNDGLIDLAERVQVRKGGRRVFNDFVAADAGVMLEELAETGDRQRLYPVRIVVE